MTPQFRHTISNTVYYIDVSFCSFPPDAYSDFIPCKFHDVGSGSRSCISHCRWEGLQESVMGMAIDSWQWFAGQISRHKRKCSSSQRRFPFMSLKFWRLIVSESGVHIILAKPSWNGKDKSMTSHHSICCGSSFPEGQSIYGHPDLFDWVQQFDPNQLVYDYRPGTCFTSLHYGIWWEHVSQRHRIDL